jgi:hypothetical protein
MVLWHVTDKGYLRGWVGGRQRLEHDVVWEQANGPIPPGHDIHHIDGDKQHNDLSNLVMLDQLTHKRIHSGCDLRDGVWWKPCTGCGETKPVTDEHWYFTKRGWVSGRCRPCFITRVVEAKRARRARARNLLT